MYKNMNIVLYKIAETIHVIHVGCQSISQQNFCISYETINMIHVGYQSEELREKFMKKMKL